MLHVAVLLNRIALGLYILLAGVGKVRGGVESFYKESFLPLKPEWLPETVASPYGHALPFIEVVLGGLLILGWWGRLAPGATMLMLISFTIALYQAGAFFKGPGPFHTNVILVTLALILTVTGSGRASLDGIFGRRSKQPALEPEESGTPTA